ncbi:MAG: flagellar biosynthesis protein FlgA [Pelagibacteraceae bacterium]|jgi:sialic acid synthase SpsE|nr:flagellar biosynthesis protein FlgA [Pelagibacteraceae bacterium]MBT6170886.1 flagellar biosynthesis protein FlgA [Flavobacteriaceae bacterium]MBT6448018.1 flagellar biosynthesis protein FlgA [Flavobacteriaceae bacterium]
MFLNQFKIGKTLVGEGQPAYIIAEIGANFNGSIDQAKKLCDAAKEAGANCAKFQSFVSEKIVSAVGFSKMNLKGVHGTWDKTVSEVFKEVEFPREWHKEIKDYCDEIRIDFSTSPYDFDAVDLCEKLNLPFIKIGSGEITWHEMIEYIATKNMPIIMATGDATLSEVDEAVNIIRNCNNNKLILLQCITNYPSKIESANIKVLNTYKSAFNVPAGYSDHSHGDLVVLGSIALGGCVVEKHFTINKNDKGPDHPHSLDVKEFSNMVKNIRLMEKALGSSKKDIVEEESETVFVQRRGLYAASDINLGEIITEDKIEVLRPALGILPKYKKVIIGKKSKIDIKKGEPIYWDNF